ncbi:MAG: hypothetical protein AAFV29_00045 [Myxococcota bacterium]
MSQLTADTAYRFLLGELAEEVHETLEARIFEDDELFDAMSVHEADLIEAYLDDGLSATRRAAFEARYLEHPARRNKVETARALRSKAAPAPSRSWSWAWLFAPRWSPALAAAAVVAAIVIVRPGPSPEEPGPQASVARVSLVADTVRTKRASRSLAMPKDGWVEAELALDGPSVPTRAKLLQNGKVLWTGAPVRSSSVAAWVNIPASSFTPGRSTIELWEGGSSSESFVAEYSLIVSPNDAGVSPSPSR